MATVLILCLFCGLLSLLKFSILLFSAEYRPPLLSSLGLSLRGLVSLTTAGACLFETSGMILLMPTVTIGLDLAEDIAFGSIEAFRLPNELLDCCRLFSCCCWATLFTMFWWTGNSEIFISGWLLPTPPLAPSPSGVLNVLISERSSLFLDISYVLWKSSSVAFSWTISGVKRWLLDCWRALACLRKELRYACDALLKDRPSDFFTMCFDYDDVIGSCIGPFLNPVVVFRALTTFYLGWIKGCGG